MNDYDDGRLGYEDDVFTGIAWALPFGLLVWALVWWLLA